MPDHNPLGDFLRARRAELQPSDVGLPTSGRRRTPGLRREEVATLAGVSVDYLVRLEQGRDTHPSLAVVSALAGALQLDEDERLQLYTMASKAGHEELCPTATMTQAVAPSLRQLVERLDPTPTFVIALNRDVLAWNEAYARVATALGLLDGAPPNLARFVFQHRQARDVLADWAHAADDHVSALRTAAVLYRYDDAFGELIADLSTEPEFARRWSAHRLAAKRRGLEHLVHPEVGDLRLVVEVLSTADDSNHSLVSWLAADEATDAALTSLTSRRRLRLVQPTSVASRSS